MQISIQACSQKEKVIALICVNQCDSKENILTMFSSSPIMLRGLNILILYDSFADDINGTKDFQQEDTDTPISV